MKRLAALDAAVVLLAGFGLGLLARPLIAPGDPPDITLESYGPAILDPHAELFCKEDGGVEALFQSDSGRYRFVVCKDEAQSGRYDLDP